MTVVRKQILWVVAAVLLFYLPFIKQPFHIDDYLYIDMARNAFRNPWFIQKMPFSFEGTMYPDMGSHSHPPFISYFIAGLMGLFNQRRHLSEAWFHLGYAVFPLTLSVSALFLARRFTTAPVPAALLLMVTPVVVINSHLLSPDIITLTFWVTGVTAFIYAVDTGRARLFVLAAAAAGLAVYTSYQAISMVGLFWLYAALQKKWDRRVWVAGLAPMAVLATWLVVGSWYYGRFLFSHTVQFAAERAAWSGRLMIEKFMSVWIDLGGTTAFPVFVLGALAAWRSGLMVLLMGMTAAVLTVTVAPLYPWWEKILMTLFLTTGLTLLARIIWRGWVGVREWMGSSLAISPETAPARDQIFLTVWVMGVFVYCVAIFFTFTARYMLPMVPPAMLLLVKETDIRPARGRRWLTAGILATLTVAMLGGAADYQFAAVYPKIANHLKDTYGKAGWKLWYAGEWGFRYYCEAAGAEILVSEGRAPRGGDLVVRPDLASGYAAPQDIETMLIPIERRPYGTKLPLRLLDRFAHAGFHGTYRGLLPFSLSRRSIEEITVKQVSLLIDELPKAAILGAAGPQSAMPAGWTLDGQSKVTLQQIPDSSVTYRLWIPDRAQLVFHIGLMGSEAVETPLLFSVAVRKSASEEQEVFKRSVRKPESGPVRWIPDAVSLGDYALQTVDLTLRIRAESPAPPQSPRRGGWGDFVIVPISLSN